MNNNSVNSSMNFEFLIKIPLLIATDNAAIIGAELTSMCPHGQDTTKKVNALNKLFLNGTLKINDIIKVKNAKETTIGV